MPTQRVPTVSRLAVAALALGLLLAGGGPAAATEAGSARDLAARVLDCTVGIHCRTEPWCAHYGSGFVVSPGGHVLTATSVVPPNAEEIRISFPDWVERDASIVWTDERLAVTLLKVEAEGLPFLPLARDLPALGEVAFTAGDVAGALASGGRASFSRGRVSGIYDVPRGPESAYAGTCIETTAALNPGSDGGPLVDAAGRACGVLILGVHPARWQGTAVPAAMLVEPLASFLPAAPPAAVPAAPAADDLATVAATLARSIVGIEVKRGFPPETLPQPTWDEYRGRIPGWDKLDPAAQERRFEAFLAVSRVLEVNQLLRRPPGPVTGVLVSQRGHVLTSLFNVVDDTATVERTTGRPRDYDVYGGPAELAAEPEKNFERRPNRVTAITVVLANGSRRRATLLARHEPLGVALLEIEPVDQPALDLAAAASPLVGDRVGIVGHQAGGRPALTLNAGIVSAPARNRGFRFQTDALVNYGNSGGPVFDRAGSLLGIAVAPLEPETVLGRIVDRRQLPFWTRAPNSGVGLVARADRIRDALPELLAGRSFERVPGPYLGVQADEAKAFAPHVTLAAVSKGSPAERAGLKPGDVLVECDGVELRGWPDLLERIASHRAGDALELRVQRRGGPRLVIAGRDVETAADLEALKRSLQPGQTFEGVLSTDDSRTVSVVLGDSP
jgi:S1-C subfamily serine protease